LTRAEPVRDARGMRRHFLGMGGSIVTRPAAIPELMSQESWEADTILDMLGDSPSDRVRFTGEDFTLAGIEVRLFVPAAWWRDGHVDLRFVRSLEKQLENEANLAALRARNAATARPLR
jgi:hypothetical protein